jgi:hypothetical protein
MSFQETAVMNVSKITADFDVIERERDETPFSVLHLTFSQDNEPDATMKVFFTATSPSVEASRVGFAERVAEAINCIEWEDGI